MPRDGSNIYSPPAGTNGVANYTIESTKYNNYVADVAQDLNLPRPIVAGGTGATNATDAMTSLQGDKAYQVVTNYDSYPFLSGSFYSAAGATSAPTGNAFIGICYTSDPAVVPPAVPASANMFIEARDVTTGINYVRQKTAGVWGAWATQSATSIPFTPAGNIAATTVQAAIVELDTEKVAKAGDTMTGPLVLPADPTLALQSATKQYVDTGDATGITAIGARAVRYDAAQGLTAAQQVQARQNIYAAPFDALAYNGMQINGSMEVSQVNGGSLVVSAANGYVLDGVTIERVGTFVINSQQVADAPPGLSNSLKITVTTAQASLGGTDHFIIQMPIEGYRVARLGWGGANAQSLALGFWTKIHRTGLYSGAIRAAGATRVYVFSFTQNVADTWEFKTVTLPGDTTGTWDKVNGVGMFVDFTMAAGASVTGAAGVWTGGGPLGVTGTTNGVAATSDVFQVTGLIVLPGLELPPLDRAPLIMRPTDQELLTCMRYYEKSFGAATNPAQNAGSGNCWFFTQTVGASTGQSGNTIQWKVRKRANPTVTLFNPAGANAQVRNLAGNDNSSSVATGYETGASLDWVSAPGSTPGQPQGVHWIADARL